MSQLLTTQTLLFIYLKTQLMLRKFNFLKTFHRFMTMKLTTLLLVIEKKIKNETIILLTKFITFIV